jgi:hypothetical protein
MRTKGPHGDLIAEADKRLEQLEWIVGRLHRLQVAQDRLYARGPRQASSHARWATHQRLSTTEVELLTEGVLLLCVALSADYQRAREGPLLELLPSRDPRRSEPIDRTSDDDVGAELHVWRRRAR